MEDTKPGAKDLFALIKKSPALMATFVVGGLVLLYIIIKHGANNNAQNTNTSGDLPTTNAQGSFYQGQSEPIAVPIFLPYNASQQVGGAAPGTQTSDPSAGVPGNGSTGSTSSTIPSNFWNEIGIIRTRGNAPTASQFDATHSGIPIRSQPQPGNDETGTIPYGTPVTITGAPVQGGNNFGGNNSNGTTEWYPVKTSSGQTGYVSAYDVQSTSGSTSATQNSQQNTSTPGVTKTMTR